MFIPCSQQPPLNPNRRQINAYSEIHFNTTFLSIGSSPIFFHSDSPTEILYMFLKATTSPKYTLSINFSSRNPKKATEHTEKPLPVYSKSNIKLNTRHLFLFYVHYMQRKSTANLKLIENLTSSPETSTVYGELC